MKGAESSRFFSEDVAQEDHTRCDQVAEFWGSVLKRYVTSAVLIGVALTGCSWEEPTTTEALGKRLGCTVRPAPIPERDFDIEEAGTCFFNGEEIRLLTFRNAKRREHYVDGPSTRPGGVVAVYGDTWVVETLLGPVENASGAYLRVQEVLGGDISK